MSTKNPAPARGSRDVLPKEALLRSWATSEIVATYTKHGFYQVETPIIENIEWLTGGVGGENEKLLFKILKRGEKLDLGRIVNEDDLCDLALRFDLTVPLTRYFANNQSQLPLPFKAIQIGPVFRAERPQKGRFRQFTQCDIDIFGEPSYLAELELIGASTEALCALSLTGFELRLNDRKALEALGKFCGFSDAQSQDLFITLDKLDKVGIDGVAKELSSRDLAKSSVDRVLKLISELKDGRDPFDFYGEIGVDSEVLDSLGTIASFATRLGGKDFSVKVDPTIVRGMGYYTGTVFEVTYPGWNSSIAGGGRYDKMLERYGKASPAVGFSLGFERILSILNDKPDIVKGPPQLYMTLLFSESDSIDEIYDMANTWRAAGYNVSLQLRKAKLGNQLKRLESEAKNIKSEGDFFGVLIFGQDSEPRAI